MNKMFKDMIDQDIARLKATVEEVADAEAKEAREKVQKYAKDQTSSVLQKPAEKAKDIRPEKAIRFDARIKQVYVTTTNHPSTQRQRYIVIGKLMQDQFRPSHAGRPGNMNGHKIKGEKTFTCKWISYEALRSDYRLVTGEEADKILDECEFSSDGGPARPRWHESDRAQQH